MVTAQGLQVFNDSPLFKALGFRVIDCDEQHLVLEVGDNNPCHQGGFGTLKTVGINGAVISAALECAIGLCGFHSFGGRPAGVVELSVKMLRVIRKKPCRIDAVIDKKSRDIAFVSAVLYSAHGGKCATATGIVMTSQREESVSEGQ
ncbi:oxidoreductase [Lonsdalea britannica]|uniref:PaaI family thioesterase n=1 Tax=Lonsdalea britannica TaxID=1082704 RepID=A0AAD0WKU3_9GAMM|nr:PaaI family thioesterase [Lonsdalea britannica]AXW87065.1 PaaI family thioesterase [Lonsdalea britannica]OSM99252.1 oxidoreductase [Lonsdalea britannica]OSN03709.1 oxidoreductase [Lonsdalea britannica]